MKKRVRALFALALSAAMSFGLVQPIYAADEEKTITVLQTSDLHGFIYPHDYAADAPANGGYARVASIVKEERSKNENLILMDTGDTLQGNMVENFRFDEVHPMIKAMNIMGYDMWTLGNHEFNYEFKATQKAIDAFEGDVVVANIYKKNGQRFADPYKIFDFDGVKVAIIGLVAPHVPEWEASDAGRYDNMTFTDPVEECGKVLEELEGKADVVLVNAHYGRDGEKGTLGMAEVAKEYSEELDGIFVGHAHQSFAEEVNGVPMVEPGSNGSSVGKMTINLTKTDGEWEVEEVLPELISTKEVEADKDVLDGLKDVNEKSLAMANEVVGKIGETFFEDTAFIPGIPRVYVEDSALIDLINTVQLKYSGADVSMAATFGDYLNLEKGEFKVKDAVKIYKYDNTLYGVKVTGKTLKAIMEKQAGNFFNQAKAGDVTASFNPELRSYTYDMFAGVDYDINISKPAGERIENVMYKGAPLKDEEELVLAVNNYRFGNLMTAGLLSKDDIVFDSSAIQPDQVRAMSLEYVKENGEVMAECDNNWKITGIDTTSDTAKLVYDKVRNGEITVAQNNAEALNIYDLSDKGMIPAVERPAELPEEKPEEATAYTVVAGDCLSVIAQKFNTTYQKIAEDNNIANPNLIFVGQIVYIY